MLCDYDAAPDRLDGVVLGVCAASGRGQKGLQAPGLRTISVDNFVEKPRWNWLQAASNVACGGVMINWAAKNSMKSMIFNEHAGNRATQFGMLVIAQNCGRLQLARSFQTHIFKRVFRCLMPLN